jgi:hypothetical protein
MLFPLGLLSQGGGAGAGDAFELISTTVLGSATSSITLSSIPATYTSLQLRIVGRSANGAQFDEISLRFNSDSGANYGNKYIKLDTSNAPSQASDTGQTAMRILGVTGNTATANNFSALKMDIIGYKNTNMKTQVRGFGGATDFVSSWQSNASLFAGLWNATTTVTSLTVATWSGANLATGTRVSLYGVL